jgi:hypothetical protein
MKKIFFNLYCLLIIVIAGCTYNKEEELYPNTGVNCDTSNVRFTATIVPILQKYECSFCHSSVTLSGNISLANYNSVKTQVNNGRLFGAINHQPGFSPMPQGGNKMNQCDINKVKAWIDAGALIIRV